MDTKKLLAALDKLPEYLLENVKILSGGDPDIMEGAKNVISAWNELDIFFRRLNRLQKMIVGGVPITDDGDIILVNAWNECKPDADKFIRRMHSLREIPEITDPAELPEYLSDTDLSVVEAAELKLRELTEAKNGR